MNELAHHIIDLANSKKAFSDIHIEQDSEVMWRRPNGWEPTGYGFAMVEELHPFCNVVSKDYKRYLEKSLAVDRSIDLTNTRLRCNIYRVGAGQRIAVAIRRLPMHPIPIEETGLPLVISTLASVPKGLLLVSGATGSGKTTTLASLTSKINETRAAHIVTIEDPLEYVFQRGKSIISQREVGVDAVDFATGLREALRQRPDVIMIGEIRDKDTAETALRAAESGLFVMATIHARNAIGALQKMISFSPDEAVSRSTALANTLVGVLAQVLVPSIDGERFQMAAEIILNADAQITASIADPAKHKALEDQLRRGTLKGGLYMNTSLAKMVLQKKITREHALAASYNSDELRLMLEAGRDTPLV